SPFPGHASQQVQGLEAGLDAVGLGESALCLADELALATRRVHRTDRAGPKVTEAGEGQERRSLHLEVRDALARELIDDVRIAWRKSGDCPTLRAVEARRRGRDADMKRTRALRGGFTQRHHDLGVRDGGVALHHEV